MRLVLIGKMEPEQAIELVYAFLEQFIDLDDIPPEFVLNGDPTAIASILWSVVVEIAFAILS